MVFPAYRSPLQAPVEHNGTTHSSGPLSGARKHLGARTAPLAEYTLSIPQPYFLGTWFVCNRGWYHRVGQLQAALRRASGTEGAGGQRAISLNRRLPRSLSPLLLPGPGGELTCHQEQRYGRGAQRVC